MMSSPSPPSTMIRDDTSYSCASLSWTFRFGAHTSTLPAPFCLTWISSAMSSSLPSRRLSANLPMLSCSTPSVSSVASVGLRSNGISKSTSVISGVMLNSLETNRNSMYAKSFA